MRGERCGLHGLRRAGYGCLRMRVRLTALAAAVAAGALALTLIGPSPGGPTRAEAIPACSLPRLSAEKLEAGLVAVAQYRKQLEGEFSPKLQGYAKGGKLPPIRPNEFERILQAQIFRIVFGLNPSTRLIRRLTAAKARGVPGVIRFFGIPITLLERDLLRFVLRAELQVQRLDLYGKACAPGGYAGFFASSFGGPRGLRLAVRFKQDREFHAQELRSHLAIWQLVKVLSADFSLNELKRTVAAMTADRELLERKGIRILFRFIDPEANRIEALIIATDARRAQEVIFNRYGDAVEGFFLQTRAGRALRAERREHRRFVRMHRRAAELLLGRDLRTVP